MSQIDFWPLRIPISIRLLAGLLERGICIRDQPEVTEIWSYLGTLVERDVVDFLAGCERKGIELRNFPAFLREWVAKQQGRIGQQPAEAASGAISDGEGGAQVS